MNSYQVYQHGALSNNRIRPNDLRLNYVYNRANQNIDHLKQNYNNTQNDVPIRVTKKVYRNESNEISSILNNDPYQINKRFSELNSSNNYNSTNYSSFQSNINSQNNFPNNTDINSLSQYSNFYNRNNNYNYNESSNYPQIPIYSRNVNINSVNDINNNMNRMRNSNPNSNGMVNFNGINMNIGSKINNYNNIIRNNSYENRFRKSNYSNKSENINIGNNHYNINLSSVTSQDIYQSFEKQKKENERKKKEEYSNYLKRQIDEKNKRKELERQKKLKEEMEYEAKYENEYKNLQQKDLDEKINETNNKIKNNDDEQIIKKDNIENNIKFEGNELDKNIIETLRKNQYPLINDSNEIDNANNRNKRNNYKKYNTELSKEKIPTNSSIIKSGMNIIEGNKSKKNFYQRESKNNKDLNINLEINNSSKKIDPNKETELYLDKIIQKTSGLTENLNKPQIEDDQRIKDIYKILENNKQDSLKNKDNYESKNNNNFTPDKNNIYKNKFKEKEIQDVNLGAINFHSKYENYDNNNYLSNNKSGLIQKSKYSSNIKNIQDDQIKESMKGISEFIASTSRKPENISGMNLFNNPNNNSKNTAIFTAERKKDKKYILKGDILQKQINSNKKSDDIEVKDSLNSNMKITFGEGGNLKFSMANNNPKEYNNKINESISAFNNDNNQEKSIKQYTFGDKFEKEKNDTKIIEEQKEEKEEDEVNIDDEDDEEKYDIKVNSENDINYDNMLKSTKKTELKFLDFDQFCDTELDKEEDKKKKKKKKKKKTSIKDQKENIDENDELCNITISDEEKDKNKESIKENENKNKLTESKKVQMQLNFFSDSITKGISHKRNDKSIFRNNRENLDEDNTNLLSNESFEKNKNKKSKDDKIDSNNNILEESDDLKDSFGDNILKNIDKYRGDLQDE